MSKFEV